MQRSIKQLRCSTTLVDKFDKWQKYRKKSKGGATGSNYVGVVRRAEEYNYMTLCGHVGSKV